MEVAWIMLPRPICMPQMSNAVGHQDKRVDERETAYVLSIGRRVLLVVLLSGFHSFVGVVPHFG